MSTLRLTTKTRLFYLRRLILPVVFVLASLFLLRTLPVENTLYPDIVQADAASLTDFYESGKDYLELTVTDLHATGFQYTSEEYANQAVYYTMVDEQCIYYFLELADYDSLPLYIDSYQFKGKMLRNPVFLDEIGTAAAEDMQWSESAVKEIAMPFIISETDYQPQPLYIFTLVVLSGCVICALSVLITFIFMLFPKISFRYKKKSKVQNAQQSTTL